MPAQVSLGREDAYMVLCSDGIYEFMSNDEIINIVHTQAQCGAQPATVAKLLVQTRPSGVVSLPCMHETACTHATCACLAQAASMQAGADISCRTHSIPNNTGCRAALR